MPNYGERPIAGANPIAPQLKQVGSTPGEIMLVRALLRGLCSSLAGEPGISTLQPKNPCPH